MSTDWFEDAAAPYCGKIAISYHAVAFLESREEADAFIRHLEALRDKVFPANRPLPAEVLGLRVVEDPGAHARSDRKRVPRPAAVGPVVSYPDGDLDAFLRANPDYQSLCVFAHPNDVAKLRETKGFIPYPNYKPGNPLPQRAGHVTVGRESVLIFEDPLIEPGRPIQNFTVRTARPSNMTK